ncbi:MAG: hypothetical protein GY711_18745 [bacterium]|nr:hypothetical protein [bacterium]
MKGLHELRSLAHVVDMHQLTKDPEALRGNLGPTESSPERGMTDAEMTRYFDYCCETLSLIAKIGAIYIEGQSDQAVVTAVDEIEELTTGLSRKIWQKIMLLQG